MNRRGQANIIVVLLLVILAIGAVYLVWNFAIQPVLTRGGEQLTVQTACLDLGLRVVSCNSTGQIIYERGNQNLAEGVKFTKIKLIYEFGTGATNVVDTTTNAGVLERRTATSGQTAVTKASVAGVLTIAGEDSTCTETARVNCG